MYTYRITKYNPKYRTKKDTINENGAVIKAGAYTRDEWTEYSDIGKKFGGKVLSNAQYMKFENAYIKVLIAFLEESDVAEIKITNIQNPKKIEYGQRLIKKNQVYYLVDLEQIFRLILRGNLWCKFKNSDGVYVDFGWDYYSYVGVLKSCRKSIGLAKQLSLYVEKFPEPNL